MEFRMRRIRFGRSYRVVGEEDPNPFDRVARRPDHGRPLRVCFHTTGLYTLSGEQADIIAELCAPYRRTAIEIMRTPGSAPADWNAFPTFEMNRWSDDTGSVWVERGQTSMVIGIHAPRGWSYEVRTRLEGSDHKRSVIELLTARELGDADVLITGDEDLLALRAAGPIDLLPLLSLHEALPLVGLWSRAIGQSYLAGATNIADWYPVVLAQAVVRESWADFAVLVEGRDALPDGLECWELATSIFTRLGRVTSTLDQLALKWLRRSQHGTDIDLDQIILGVSAIQDNLALLVGRFLGIHLSNPQAWSLRNPAWQKAVADAGGERGQRLRQYVIGATPWLKVALELRHHAVHRTVLANVRYVGFPSTEDRIRLPERVVAAITRALDELGESPAAWGISGTSLVGDRSADLDPLPFAARLIAGTARLINGVVGRLAPSEDSRYPEDIRTAARLGRIPPFKDDLFSPENCHLAVLSGPLSGLVEAS